MYRSHCLGSREEESCETRRCEHARLDRTGRLLQMNGGPVKARAYGLRVALLVAAAVGCALAAVLLPPFAQPQSYHHFADTRTILGIANAFDALSSVPMLLVGIAGLVLVGRGRRGMFADPAERWAYAVFFAGAAFTGIGSTYYHLAPDDARLVWDRLPMTVVFTSLLAAIIAERVDTKAGVRLVAPVVTLGIASVVYWRWSTTAGAGNIVPYVVTQLGSFVLAALRVALFPSHYTHAGRLTTAVALYVVAKLAELLDAWLYSLGHLVSGHTLKHLLAACALYQVLRMLRERSTVGSTLVRAGSAA